MTARLPAEPGQWIDRGRTLKFTFEGQPYTGFAGDTITSALAAGGVRLLGRSFKYHRARGIYSLANHDVNVLVDDGRRTNLRADVTPLWDGAVLRAVNTRGGVVGDKLRIVDWFSKLLPVGFYYKAFHRPARWFPFYERQMRKIAGLGAVRATSPREHFPAVYDFCDVLVVGAGPAGLSAAIAAAELGLHVVVVDENQRPFGSLNYLSPSEPGAVGLRAALEKSGAKLDVRCSTVAVGNYADHWVALVDEQRLTKMRARCVVLATGAIEQPAVFANNDLPGVMLATAAQRLVRQFAVRPSVRAVVLAANDYGYRAALDLRQAGVEVAAIVDPRHHPPDSPALKAVDHERVPIYSGHAVEIANPTRGKLGVRGLQIRPLDESGQMKAAGMIEIACDGLAISVGFAPADGLFYQGGGRMQWSDSLDQFIPKSAPDGLFAAGRLNGIYGCEAEAADGRRAGLAAAAYLGQATAPPTSEQPDATSPNFPYPVFPHSQVKCFVDLDEDVHYQDLVNAAQEGFDQVELMKRYSTFGMGTSQGKLANLNAIRILARVKGQTVPQTGVTTSRPFIQPVTLGHLAGRGFHPHRRSPLEGRHEALRAEFMNAGDWRRPAYYIVDGLDAAAAIAQEVTTVRNAVGLIDVGTLGKIEINGPDAGEFVERIYTGRFARMKVGTARYGLMCDESGVIIDDGLVARLADDRFYVTTTTSASGAVYREMQRWAIIWGLQVVLASATGLRGGINVTGPRAQQLLAGLCDFDVSSAAFPYMAVREGSVAGVSGARCLRVGFVGEWGCEIHVPAYHIPAVWDAIVEAGRPLGIRPFGVEAQRILRLEKAHIIVSQDTDGLTNPYEANMGWAVKDDKPFFIGQRSLRIIHRRPLHRVLVGWALPSEHESSRMPKECHLIIENREIVGRVTSVVRSPTLGHPIGMAFVRTDRSQPGTQFQIRLDDGTYVTAQVVETPFYDPQAQRQSSPAR